MSSLNLKKMWEGIVSLFDEDPISDEPIYDPVHVGGVVVLSLAGLGILFWLLWSLLVCEGDRKSVV